MIETLEIKINKKTYFISARADVPIRYKVMFGRDIFDDFSKIKNNKDETLSLCLLFCMTDKSSEEFCKFFIENNSYITSKHHYEAIRLFEKHFISKPVTYSLEDIVQILTTYLENTKTQIGGKNE
jgi:hypothetical protein|nr:hypothetical protein [Streptococcus infantis]DAF13156.1 MAG TPA: hypothetical protein [Caudoviricetes sp.]